MIEHLQQLGIAFQQRRVDDQGLYQLFFKDPVNSTCNSSASPSSSAAWTTRACTSCSSRTR
jgi:hypothetical protein